MSSACSEGVRREDTHHNVQTAKRLDRLVDGSLHICLLAHVGADDGSLDVGRALVDELEGLFGGLEVDVHEEDVRAFLRKQEGGLEANATALSELARSAPRSGVDNSNLRSGTRYERYLCKRS